MDGSTVTRSAPAPSTRGSLLTSRSLGALVGGRLAERVQRPFTTYAALEALLGVFGALSPSFLEALGRSTAGAPWSISLGCMALFLSVPTLAMGMTLPVLVKGGTQLVGDFLESVGLLYFVNTLGAAVGAVVASYGAISFFGLDRAVFIAAGINATLALVTWRVSTPRSSQPSAAVLAAQPAGSPGLGRWAWGIVAFTGFVAIGYELIWFRWIEILVKASPYAFSTVLAVYLSGIGVGCHAMTRHLRRNPGLDRRRLFFRIQGLAGLYVVASTALFFHLTRETSFAVLTRASYVVTLHPAFVWPERWDASGFLHLFASIDIVLWPVLFLLVPTLLLGAAFPLASVLSQRQAGAEGETVGTLYFFNTLGNVLGGALTGLLVLPGLGTERTLLLYGTLHGLMVLGALRAAPSPWVRFRQLPPVAGLALAVALFPQRGELLSAVHLAPGEGFTSTFEEGVEGVVMTWQRGEVLHNTINGLGHGGRPGHKFYAEAIEAFRHANRVDSVLIIGFGTGSTLEIAQRCPGVRAITVVELNATLMRNLEKLALFRGMLEDPRVTLILEDGRRHLYRTAKKYDLILMDPLRSTTAYSNNLYSRQFFSLAQEHLESGGVFLLWLDEQRVLPGTLATVFEAVDVYSFFALAGRGPFVDRPEIEAAILATFPEELRAGIMKVPRARVGDRESALDRLGSLPINQDWRPVAEYYLGLRVRQTRFGLPNRQSDEE